MATVAPTRPRAGRNAEIGLLLLALVVGVSAYAIVGLNLSGELPPDLWRHLALLAGMAVVLHLALRWRAPDADPVMLPLVIGLNGLGLAMIARIDVSLESRGLTAGFAGRQLTWTIIGVALAVATIVLLRDHRMLRRFTFSAMVAGLVLLCLPMVPVIGREINGARLWIGVGGMSFQPAELAKILLAVFFAGYFVTRRDGLTLAGTKMLGLRFPRLSDLFPIVLIWAISVGVLVVERDLGTSLLFFGLFVSMLYVATEKVSWIVIGLLLVAVGVVFAYLTFPYVAARFDVWLHALDPEIFNRDPGGSGQLVRGLFGLAAGGLMGTGLGQGHPDLVPYANSDFIVASLGEELGLTGLLAILIMYLVVAQRGLRAAIGVRDGFGKLLAAGFAFVIAFQVFVVVGGVTRLIPLTGLTMPFMAAGGSSLVANWIIVAIMLRVSDAARRPAPSGAGSVVGNETAAIALADLDRHAARTSSPRSLFGWDHVTDAETSSSSAVAHEDDTFASAPTEHIGTRSDLAAIADDRLTQARGDTDLDDGAGMSRARLDGPGGSERGTSERVVGLSRDIPAASGPDRTPTDPEATGVIDPDEERGTSR
ncbi:MAG TPA: FtsW/RodA/SpoVE family cell cycle protein [Actinotalea caeni]|uniref:FtsW/RodA/SpoVE family cell cycle protein n=1 Tax=Actinotalea caeni TaxID=1348467 RepID=UPI002B4B628D|nr:FtsW/RodA/SpoVE family cell cycle protein [Actinotalea caeni]HLV55786.1 FtsW/RodA/SpoVE family cell cycle protein [Actinotalea caeni]